MLDIISIFWIISTFLILGYVATYVDLEPGLALKGVVGFSLMLGGLVLAWITIGIDVDRKLSLKEVVNGLFLVFASVLIIALIDTVTWEYLTAISPELSAIEKSQFTMLMGTVEEVVFRGFLLSFLIALTDNTVISLAVSSVIGATFHAAVYGMEQGLMIFVAVSFFALGVIYLMSRGEEDPRPRLWVTITAHGLVNLIASMGGI